MPNFINQAQERRLLLGDQVISSAQALPSEPGTATLFTVHAGAVLVTLLAGQVTVALSGTTGAIALGTAPTGGATAETSGIATAGVVGGAEVGSWVTAVKAITGLAGAVQANLFGGNAVGISALPFIVSAGAITVTTSVATITGTLNWYLQYVPLDTGAYVGAGTS